MLAKCIDMIQRIYYGIKLSFWYSSLQEIQEILIIINVLSQLKIVR